MNGIHPAPTEFSATEIQAEPILQFFHYAHLPEVLQRSSEPFCNLAFYIMKTLPRSAERAVALRKLLEAKDAAVAGQHQPRLLRRTACRASGGV